MPKICGHCGKYFKNHTCVRKHQSQPKSYCRTLYNETLRINQTLARPSRCSVDPQHIENYIPTSSIRNEDNLGDIEPSLFQLEEDLSPQDNPNDPDVQIQSQAQILPCPVQSAQSLYTLEFDPTNKGTEFHVEKYPFASQTCGQGETFLDLFKKDPFSEKRVAFPYYPFASKDEWELAYFLLRSDLSMNAQNSLLQTKLVRFP